MGEQVTQGVPESGWGRMGVHRTENEWKIRNRRDCPSTSVTSGYNSKNDATSPLLSDVRSIHVLLKIIRAPMAYRCGGWVKGGVRGLRSCGAFRLHASLINNTRYRFSCNAEKAVTAVTSPVSTSPLVSTLVTRADGHSTQRSHVTVGALRCASGDASQRSTSDFQRRCMQTSTPALAVEVLSTIAGGLRPAGPGATSGLPTWSSFSTSTDKPSKKAQGLMEGGGVDGVPLAAADVAQVAEPTKDEPRHAHIEMPSITDVGVNQDLVLLCVPRDTCFFL